MSEPEWVWMPHAAHLIVGHECRFHLATYVNGYIVSTVGEWWPDRQVREIHANSRGIAVEGRGEEWDRDFQRKCGFMEIGLDRLYETMVFRAMPHNEGCCQWRQADGDDLDFDGYNDAKSAREGHYAMCAKWANAQVPACN